jgi:hypothetical protein
MARHKLKRLEKQKRRLWYGDSPTRFGAQYMRLKYENYSQTIEVVNDTGAHLIYPIDEPIQLR